MATPKFTRTPYKAFSKDMIDRYNLQDLVFEKRLCIRQDKKGMYGLKQAALLAYNKLVKHLAPFGYHPLPFSLGLWTHETQKTCFSFCIDG